MRKENTLKAFCKNSNIPSKLIRSTVRQFGGWGRFKEFAADVASGGGAAGWGGFIYYTDTCAFTARNKALILKYMECLCEDVGYDGVITCLSNFNCLKGLTQSNIAEGLYNHRSDYRTDVYNALAWFALDEVACAYVNWIEDEE